MSVVADNILRGESGHTFVQFLQELRCGHRPMSRIVSGEPCADLDNIPAPDCTQFFRQVKACSTGPDNPYGHWLVCESSRGCWWGEKRYGLPGDSAVDYEEQLALTSFLRLLESPQAAISCNHNVGLATAAPGLLAEFERCALKEVTVQSGSQ